MRVLVALILAAVLAGCATSDTTGSAAKATKAPRSQPTTLILDVRTPQEFSANHLPGAINLPLAELESRISTVAPAKNQPIVVHCQSGGRSTTAKAKLDQLGYTQVRNLGSIANARLVLNLPEK